MSASDDLIHYGFRPDIEGSVDTPCWIYYEISEARDAVLRTVDLFADGRIERTSIVIEQRNGNRCRSLVNTSIIEGFEGIELQLISSNAFEEFWDRGVDTPIWFK